MNYFKKLSLLIKNVRVLNEFINNLENGYFSKTGWLKSYKNKSPQNIEGQPIPWVTYSFLQFIDSRLSKDMTGFEYGSGSSSRYFARKIGTLYSVEHDEKWYSRVKEGLPENIQLNKFRKDSYAESINNSKGLYDFILVDAIDRVACIKESISKLKPSGVLILDDSEREEYEEGKDILKSHGYKELPFWGFSPGSLYMKCTSIYYKSGKNIFNI